MPSSRGDSIKLATVTKILSYLIKLTPTRSFSGTPKNEVKERVMPCCGAGAGVTIIVDYLCITYTILGGTLFFLFSFICMLMYAL